MPTVDRAQSLHRELTEPLEKFKTPEERFAFIKGCLFELTELMTVVLAKFDDLEGEAAVKTRPVAHSDLLNRFAHLTGDLLAEPFVKGVYQTNDGICRDLAKIRGFTNRVHIPDTDEPQ